MNKIFDGLVVIELARVLAGPAVGMFFAELGAKVIKIENKKTAGDVTRKWKHPSENSSDEYSAYYHSTNWGKEKRMMDLSDSADHQTVIDLIKSTDIVISNFKAASAEKLGMDYATLRKENPRLIYGAITAYGEGNPAPGFDAMLQAETGWIHMTGTKGGPPSKMPVALIDLMAAHQLKQGLLIALMKRAESGKGSYVSISLYDTAIAALANQASNWLNLGVVPERMGTEHPNIAPYGDVFTTQDGKEIILGTGTQKQFEGLCDILGLQELKSNPDYKTNQNRLANRAQLNKQLATAINKITYKDLAEHCLNNQVTLAPINDLKTVFQNAAAKKMILEEEQDSGKVARCVRTVAFRIVRFK